MKTHFIDIIEELKCNEKRKLENEIKSWIVL